MNVSPHKRNFLTLWWLNPAILFCACGCRLGQSCTQRLVKAGQSFAMLGADRNRFAKAQRVGVERTQLTRAAFALIGQNDRGLAALANQIRKSAIGRGGAGARIDQKKDCIRMRHRCRRLRLHPRRKAIAFGLVEAGRVDNFKREIAELRVTFAPVARHARAIIDERQASPDQAVEQCRFAYVGTANDHEGEGHGAKDMA